MKSIELVKLIVTYHYLSWLIVTYHNLILIVYLLFYCYFELIYIYFEIFLKAL